MSNHNYSQYSNKKHNNNNYKNQSNQKRVVDNSMKTPVAEKIVAAEVKMDTVPDLVNETVETVTLPTTVKGVVSHCSKLNVRENATVDSGIVCVLDATSEIKIDVNKSTNNWFYIYAATGVEGYCMRQYVDASL